MRTGLTKQEKTTDIWFDEKDPLIHIRTHNTDLKKRMLAYSRRYPENCKQTDTDPETGCMEFDIEKGRFSFRLTAPYSEERREAARQFARENNTALKKRLLAYSRRYPANCQQTDADPDTGCMEFEIRKGRFSFRLTAPYNEERRRAASEAAKAAASNLTRSMI